MYFRQAHSKNFRTRGGETVKFIVVHYDAGTKATARNNVDAFATHVTGTSAHYFVDENEVAQSVPETMSAQHCGGGKYKNGAPAPFHGVCKNANSIGIELCSRKDTAGKYYIPWATRIRGARLIRELMAKYNIPIDRVIRHYDVTGKHCPAPMVDDGTWTLFRNLVQSTAASPADLDTALDKEGDSVVYYKRIEDIPAGELRENVQTLLNKGVVKGKTPNDLHLSEDMVRMFTWLKRLQVF